MTVEEFELSIKMKAQSNFQFHKDEMQTIEEAMD